MTTKYFCIVSLLIFVTQTGVSQNEHLWIGGNLTEVYFDEDRGVWFYQNERTVQTVKIDSNRYYTEWRIHRSPIDFEQLDIALDTLKLNKGLTTYLFVKPHLVKHQKFNFYAVEYSKIDTWGNVNETYHINRFGVFRKSDYKNNTLIERQIDTIKLEGLMGIVKTIDAKNVDQATGRRNNCDQQEHRFTFIDNLGNRKSYVAIQVRKQLEQIRRFMIELEAKE